MQRTHEAQRMASQMGIGMSGTSKKEQLRERSKTYDEDLGKWLRKTSGMRTIHTPNENDWDQIEMGLVLLFDDDFFRYRP